MFMAISIAVGSYEIVRRISLIMRAWLLRPTEPLKVTNSTKEAHGGIVVRKTARATKLAVQTSFGEACSGGASSPSRPN